MSMILVLSVWCLEKVLVGQWSYRPLTIKISRTRRKHYLADRYTEQQYDVNILRCYIESCALCMCMST